MQKFFIFSQIQNLSYFKQPLFGFKSVLRKIDSKWVRSSLNHNVYAIWALTGGGLFSKARKFRGYQSNFENFGVNSRIRKSKFKNQKT